MHSIPFGYFFFLTVDSIIDRDTVQPRRWGMQVEVTDDGTAANNTTWILTKGLVSTDINDNSNWEKLGAAITAGGSDGQVQYNSNGQLSGFGTYTPNSSLELPTNRIGQTSGNLKEFRIIEESGSDFLGVVSLNLVAFLPTIANNTVITIELIVSTIEKGSAGATGFAYKINGTFRKNNAGTIVAIGTGLEWTRNDTGDAFSVQTLTVSGASILSNTTLITAKTFAPLLYMINVSTNQL